MDENTTLVGAEQLNTTLRLFATRRLKNLDAT